ncbi:MAG: hypothetical protein KatS3mg119_0654 [Rhodothalassiaceae bacterium]|nr:MAG: hypothetical protein KatS3mg119_0654 [Rhodothalassiaceae bacterium]
MANEMQGAAHRPFIFSKREDVFALRADQEKIARELTEQECDAIGGGRPPRTPPTGIGNQNTTTCYINSVDVWPVRRKCFADDPSVDFN